VKRLVIIALLILALVASGSFGFIAGHYYTQYNVQKSKKIIKAFWGAATDLPGTEIISVYEEATNVKIEATWGGAGQLLSSMMISKSGDIYLGVGTAYDMKTAIEKGVVEPASVRILAYLVPAIIVSKGNPKNITCLEDLVKPEIRVGLTNPDYGAGLFVRKLLEYNGLWGKISGNYVEAESGEKAVTYVILGYIDATISWHTFHYWNPDKTDIVWIDSKKIPEVSIISAAISVYAKDRRTALAFLDFVSTSKTAKDIFNKYGYVTTMEQATKYTPYSDNTWQVWFERAEHVKASLFESLK